jgi:superfamily II DNA or RNA helicase
VASVFTAVRSLDPLRRPHLPVIDEAHLAVARDLAVHHCRAPDTDILGVTATYAASTASRSMMSSRRWFVGPSIARLIDDGWLAPVTVFTPA